MATCGSWLPPWMAQGSSGWKEGTADDGGWGGPSDEVTLKLRKMRSQLRDDLGAEPSEEKDLSVQVALCKGREGGGLGWRAV